MTEMIRGSCHCGAVEVVVAGNAFGVLACHCGDCQKLHGNFFAMLAVDRAEVQWTGDDAIRWYNSSPKSRRSFCSTCGSRLCKDTDGSGKVLVSVGLFEKTLPRRLAKNLHSDLKPDWYDIPQESKP